jgi:putative inorganic carbon (HCO3(-)) transporter
MHRLADLLSSSNQPPLDDERTDLNLHLVALALLVGVGAVLAFDPPLPIAIVVLPFAAALAVVSPVAATAAVAASTPLIFHPVQLRGSQFSLLELSLLIGSLGLGIRLAMAVVSRRLTSSLRVLLGHWQTSLAAALLIVLGCLSLLTIADPRHRPESVRDLRVVVVEPVAALVLTRWSLRQRGGAVLAIGLLGAGLAVAAIAILQVVSGRGEVIGNGVGRATGPYPHPNNLALYLERIGLFAAAIALVEPRLRRIVLPIAIVVATGLAATLSRGAMLAVFAGAALLLGIVRPNRGWRWLAVGAALIAIVFAATAGDRLFSTGTAGATSSRELIWRSSLRMAGDHPLYGVGLDQFLYQYAPRYVTPAGWPERYTSHPHNLILDFWLRLGLAGVALLIGIVALCVWQVLRLRRSNDRADRRVLAVAAATLLTGGAAHGLVDNGFFLPDLAVLTWIAIALLEPPLPEPPLPARIAPP